MKNTLAAGLLMAFFAGFSPAVFAQTPANPAQAWGSWFIGTVQLPSSPGHKWGGSVEAQVRTNALFRQYFYHELKGSVSYDLAPNVTVLLAGGRHVTADFQDRSAGPLNVEKRLWEQLALTQSVSRLRLEHRYRLEQRWFRFRDDSSAFRQRLRYRLNASLPLNAPTTTAGTVFLTAYDELFFNLQGPVFERNRLYGGAGYQVSPHITVQAGWVKQANFNLPALKQGQFVPQNTSAKNNVVLALTYKLSRAAWVAPVEHLPSPQD